MQGTISNERKVVMTSFFTTVILPFLVIFIHGLFHILIFYCVFNLQEPRPTPMSTDPAADYQEVPLIQFYPCFGSETGSEFRVPLDPDSDLKC